MAIAPASGKTGSTPIAIDPSCMPLWTSPNWIIPVVQADCVVEVIFEQDAAPGEYTVTATVTAGIGVVDPLVQVVGAGDIASMVITPATGHQLLSVQADACVVQGTGINWSTDNVYGDCNVTVEFEQIGSGGPHLVTAFVQGEHGGIWPPTQSVDDGDTAVFTITPDFGYQVGSVIGDTCSPIRSETGWVAEDIRSDCVVIVNFQATLLFEDSFEDLSPRPAGFNDSGLVWSGDYPGGDVDVCHPAHPTAQDCKHDRDAQASSGALEKHESNLLDSGPIFGWPADGGNGYARTTEHFVRFVRDVE